jgi:glyoxylase-like metal-dependent hydrolase (beta-lactamase superfamily II)
MTPSENSPYSTIDLNWTGRPKSIASVLIQSGGVNALIDPGPASTLETLRAGLQRHGTGVQDLDSILLTHIHLDHAGAVGALVKENPKLPVFVHEFGAKHMADPSKLLASAGRLYGEKMDFLYGHVLPVPQENLRPLAGGETVGVGNRKLDILYTPGHASHHLAFWDAHERTAFVGDVGGITVEGDTFIMPATPPPDVDLDLWNKSLDAILALQPAKLFLTHFGYQRDPAAHIARYRKKLSEWTALAKSLLESGKTEEEAAKGFVEAVAAETKRDVHTISEADHYIFNGGLYLSWLGLLRYTKKQKEKSQPLT